MVRSDDGKLRIADQVGSSATFAAQVQHGGPSQRRRQRQATLQHVDATQLPSTEENVERWSPVAAESSPAAKRQLPHVTRHESVSDVEFGRAAIGRQIEAVLGFAEGSGVEARRRRRSSRCDPVHR